MARLRKSARSRLPSARATSAGGIVIRETSEGKQLLLGKRLRERAAATWSLPKGTPDAGETLEETAVREVQEETGLEVRIVEPAGAIQYHFVQNGTRIHKTVHYYRMEATGGDLAAHDHEFEEVRWVDLAEAQTVMSFPTERDIVARTVPVADTA